MGVYQIRSKNLVNICEKFLQASRKPFGDDISLSELLVMATASSLAEAMKKTLVRNEDGKLKHSLPDDHVVSIEPIFMDQRVGRHIGFQINLNDGSAPVVVDGWRKIKKHAQRDPDAKRVKRSLGQLQGIGYINKEPCPAGAEVMKTLNSIFFNYSEGMQTLV